MYGIFSDALNTDIIILRAKEDDVNLYQLTINLEVEAKRKPKVIILNATGVHYETIGIVRDDEIQTMFEKDDPFVKEVVRKSQKRT